MITGATRLVAVIGYPARYSLSPQLHNAAYTALGLDAVYLALPLHDADVATGVAAIRALDFVGASVTIPHKEAVLPHLDHVTSMATRLAAVNCIARDGDQGDKLVGHNTDGVGFVSALKAELDCDPSGKRCLVLGAGGAARAIVAALAGAGAAEVAVHNRSQGRAVAAVTLAGSVGRVVDDPALADAVALADLIVNATSVGMAGSSAEGQLPLANDLAGALLHTGHAVADVVYHPLQTPLLEAAEKAGARTMNGLGLLVHQAAAQIELWFGVDAPIEVMTSVARSAVGR